MAVYRPVYTNFWTDTKVAEQFDTADITFWLYLLTNPLTNTLGCYEVPKSVISFQTKIEMDDIKRKLLKFRHEYNLIKFDEKTNEILIENWTKYNWLNSFNTFLRVKSELENIKSNMLKKELMAKLSEIYGSFIKESDGAYMGHIRGSRNKQEQDIKEKKTIKQDSYLSVEYIINKHVLPKF